MNVSPQVFKFTDMEIADMKALPRIVKLESFGDGGWDFTKSAFAKYPEEGPELFQKCLDVDWDRIKSKVSYIVKDPVQEQQIYHLIRNNYQPIIAAYKH